MFPKMVGLFSQSQNSAAFSSPVDDIVWAWEQGDNGRVSLYRPDVSGRDDVPAPLVGGVSDFHRVAQPRRRGRGGASPLPLVPIVDRVSFSFSSSAVRI